MPWKLRTSTPAGSLLGLAALVALHAQGQGGGRDTARGEVYWNVDPLRGPVDLGLADPALMGAIDVHAHLDPDAPGNGAQVRALDAFNAAVLAKSRGMRGVVMKTHQDSGSAGSAYLVRKHVSPGFEAFGRMASNFATGGINVATLVLTHPGDVPQLAEATSLGAFIEVNASGTYKTEAGLRNAAALIHKIGADHIIVGTDCGQTTNVYPTDCLALTARGLRAHGVTERELDLMYKVNPAKLLGLPALEETVPNHR